MPLVVWATSGLSALWQRSAELHHKCSILARESSEEFHGDLLQSKSVLLRYEWWRFVSHCQNINCGDYVDCLTLCHFQLLTQWIWIEKCHFDYKQSFSLNNCIERFAPAFIVKEKAKIASICITLRPTERNLDSPKWTKYNRKRIYLVHHILKNYSLWIKNISLLFKTWKWNYQLLFI